ncbi:MAG: discoidin domain-containing protein [Planctomycetes bacterium]|nr:discoidin domain-containing protein [Planctomycetota bacterium]
MTTRVPSALTALVVLAALVVSDSGGASLAHAAPEPFFLRKGDLVVFLGDSITQQQMWTRYVAQFVAQRYPDLDVRFFNAGWGGDTAKGGGDRLERDVLALAPTVVTVFFGMNDGGYRASDPKVVAAYREPLADIVKRLQAKGVRVVVMSPGCVDMEVSANLKAVDYDTTLEGLTAAAAETAKAAKCAFVDIHHPMREQLAARRKAGFTSSLVPDSVHPNEEGHYIVAAALLNGLGAEPVEPLGSFDIASGRGKGLELVEKSRDEIVLRCSTPRAAPFFVPAAAESTFRSCGMAALAAPELKLTGLPVGDWEVRFDDAEPSVFASRDLAGGAFVPAKSSARGKTVHDLVQKRETNYFDLWRNVRLPMADVPGVDEAVKGLLALDDGLHQRIRESAAVRADTFIRLSPVPTGSNLALGRAYESSDRNGAGWGVRGLTDGSWEPDATHCFATGMASNFPKTVTVDLEKSARLNAVRFGVPPFGGTRTVRVSISNEGREFIEVGKVEFAQGTAGRRTVTFDPVRARFVRLTYVDHWPDTVQYPPEFAFTTELEVYGVR